MYTHAAHAAHA